LDSHQIKNLKKVKIPLLYKKYLKRHRKEKVQLYPINRGLIKGKRIGVKRAKEGVMGRPTDKVNIKGCNCSN